MRCSVSSPGTGSVVDKMKNYDNKESGANAELGYYITEYNFKALSCTPTYFKPSNFPVFA